MIKFLPVQIKDVNEFRMVEAHCFNMGVCKDMNYMLIPIITHGYCYKAIDHDEIVGGLIAFVSNNDRIYINSLFVIEPYRQKNIATRLMKIIMERFSGKQFMLEVNPDNKHAIKFYKKLGFRKIKTVKNYFLDGEDRIIMATEENITL